MSGFDYFKMAFERFGDFKGRSRRSEYWYFALFNAIISYALMFLGSLISSNVGMGLYGLYVLAAIVPGVAVAVRRMHDVGKTGWLLLIGLIPIVGAILLLIWFVTEGEHSSNKWGPNPKYGSDDVSDHLVDETV